MFRLRNFWNIHCMIMARYLESRGWVVFYLEEELRKCNEHCWLQLYENIRTVDKQQSNFRELKETMTNET